MTPRRLSLLGATTLIAGALGACAPSSPGSLAVEEKFTKWAMYEAEPGATHYSALSQIDRSNVKDLQIAWSYPIGDNAAQGMNPIIIDTMMYVVGRGGSVVALHAATGRQLWTFPFAQGTRDRGLLYWESADRTDRRVYTTRSNFLYAINAVTGQPIMNFGAQGRVDIRQGIQRDPATINATPSSPGTVFENLVILGSGTGEGYEAGPGDIRAFDTRTGQLAWVFHTIPLPGEYGYDTWEDPNAWKRVGGANVWGNMSVDEERGIVYLPIGSATYDFWGGDRLGANLFANSLVALDARTGKRLWHYQTVHHDLWDYDLVTTPVLMTVRHEGRMRDIVAQATKQGFLFVFDRVTGEPLWPIEERPVPPSDMPGEKAWPTQPFPTKPAPFAMQSFTVDDVNPYIANPVERDSIVRIVREAFNLGLYTPPSLRPTIQMPGNHGGSNWGLSAADPTTGMYYIVAHNSFALLKMERVAPPASNANASPAVRGRGIYAANCQACHAAGLQGQPPVIPTLVGVTGRMSRDAIHAIVLEGRGLMPGHREMTDPEFDALHAFLSDPAAAPAQGGGGGGGGQAGVGAGAVSEGFPERYRTGYNLFRDSEGMPWNKGPWNVLTAYDLNTGDLKWQIPLGQVPALAARGISGMGTGGYLRGGPAITAGGLLFMATGNMLQAFDKDTGQELWTFPLPAAASGIPAVYEVGGRQYVVVGAGGGGGGGAGAAPNPAAPPRSYVAFALPAASVR